MVPKQSMNYSWTTSGPDWLSGASELSLSSNDGLDARLAAQLLNDRAPTLSETWELGNSHRGRKGCYKESRKGARAGEDWRP